MTPNNETEKRPYNAPEIVEHGSLERLTSSSIDGPRENLILSTRVIDPDGS